MTALVVLTYLALAWLLLWALKNLRVERQQRREQTSWLSQHERDLRARQRQREADESRPITWRR